MLWLILIVVAWLACGFVASGAKNAMKSVVQKSGLRQLTWADRLEVWVTILAGPFGWETYGWIRDHGWLAPWRKP